MATKLKLKQSCYRLSQWILAGSNGREKSDYVAPRLASNVKS